MADGDKIRLRQGLKANLNSTNIDPGQLLFATYEDEVRTSSNATESLTQGDIYFDKDSTHRIKIANDVDKARTLFAGQTSNNTFTGQLAATIEGIPKIYDGLTVAIQINGECSDQYNTLNINNLGNKLIWFKTGQIATSEQLKFGQELILTYRTNAGVYTVPSTNNNGLLVNGSVVREGWVISGLQSDPAQIGVYYVEGTQTAATGSWGGNLKSVYSLYDGLTIAYYLPYAGSGNASLTLNLANSTTSAIPVYWTGTSRATTHYGAGSVILLTYKNGAWRRADYNSNSDTYTSAWCGTAAGTAAKGASCSNFTLQPNSYLHFVIRYTNTAQNAITMNVNSTGAKSIYINGQPSSSTNYTLPAGSYIAFYDGEKQAYMFRTDGKLPGWVDANNIEGVLPMQSGGTGSNDTNFTDNRVIWSTSTNSIKRLESTTNIATDSTSLYPATDNTGTLGTSSNRWNTIYGNKFNAVPTGVSWIGGKTLSNAAYQINQKLNTSSYYPFMAVEMSNGDFVNIGGINKTFGIYGYYAARTANGTDWGTFWESSNGTLTHNKLFRITDTTNSSSKTTGSAVFSGGVGIGKKLYVGEDTSIDASLSVGSTSFLSGAVTANSTLDIKGTTTARDILPETTGTYSLGSSSKRWDSYYGTHADISEGAILPYDYHHYVTQEDNTNRNIVTVNYFPSASYNELNYAQLVVRDGNNSEKILELGGDGNLTWDGKNVVRAATTGEGSSSAPVYIDAYGIAQEIDTLAAAKGGTGNSAGFTKNRLVFGSDTNKLGSAASLYATGSSIAVNKTSITSGYNFEVSGKSLLDGVTQINSTTDATTHGSSADGALIVKGGVNIAKQLRVADDITLYTGDSDRAIVFGYANTTRSVGTTYTNTGASWRLVSQGSGSEDTNYFSIQSAKSNTGAKPWFDVIRMSMDNLTSYFGGNANPLADNTQSLGTNSLRWKKLWSYDLATDKAAVGADGLTVSGKTTLQASQYSDTASTGALNLQNSDIYGVNSIKFADKSDSAAEGLQWYRDTTHVDSLWVKDGVIYFTPNREYGTAGTSYTLVHSNNVSWAAWTVGTASAGPKPNITVGGSTKEGYAIPLATSTVSGVISADTQAFGGNKTFDGTLTAGSTLTVVSATTLQSTLDVSGVSSFADTTDSTSTSTGAVKISGGVGIAKSLFVGTKIKSPVVGSQTFISYPDNGYYSYSGNTTGAIKITLPQSWSATMMEMTVSIYNYGDSTTADYHISGYNYPYSSDPDGGYWVNVDAYATGKRDWANLKVRFAHDGVKSCIIIGEIDTGWAYPKVQVHDVVLGHSNATFDKWATGWSIELITELPTNIDITKNDTNILHPYENNVGSIGTANKYWKDLYVKTIHSDGMAIGDDLTIDDSLTVGGLTTLLGGAHIYGTIAGGTYSGGGYHADHNSLILHGDNSGVSGILFTSTKSSNDTVVNHPSDRAFIQYHSYGVTAKAENTAPTLATSGEAGKLVIGVGNDNTDEVWLQAPGNTGLKHQIGATSYTIADTNNSAWSAWTAGTTEGPKANFNFAGSTKTSAAIPSASSSASGVVNTTTQTFAGNKTFDGTVLLGQTLTVTGATSLNDALIVADGKATTLGGTLVVKDTATVRDIIPETADTYKLGSSTKTWKELNIAPQSDGHNNGIGWYNSSGNLVGKINADTAGTTCIYGNGKVVLRPALTGTAKGIAIEAASVTPAATNDVTLGTSSLRWKALYLGTTDSYGGINQPIYWKNGVPDPISYLDVHYGGTGYSSDVTANRVVISATSAQNVQQIRPSTTHYATDTALAVNKTSITSGYNFEVSGKSRHDGAVVNTGNTSTKTLTISSTTAEAHIQFTRTGSNYYNYIIFPSDSSIALGTAASSAGTLVRLKSGALFPERTDEINLGTSALKWKGIYTNLLNVYDTASFDSTVSFGGIASFNDTHDSAHSKDTSASISTKGGVSVEKTLSAKVVRIDNNQTTKGVSLQFNETLETLNFVFAS